MTEQRQPRGASAPATSGCASADALSGDVQRRAGGTVWRGVRIGFDGALYLRAGAGHDESLRGVFGLPTCPAQAGALSRRQRR